MLGMDTLRMPLNTIDHINKNPPSLSPAADTKLPTHDSVTLPPKAPKRGNSYQFLDPSLHCSKRKRFYETGDHRLLLKSIINDGLILFYLSVTAKKFIELQYLEGFKEAVAGSDFNKNLLIEILKKQ